MDAPTRMDGAGTASGDAVPVSSSDQLQSVITTTIQALELVHNPLSSQESRLQAFTFLDKVQSHLEATDLGALLALDQSRSPEVRHYGLSLLEKASTRPDGHSVTVFVHERLWQLAIHVRDSDPSYIRNTIARVWVSYAKRYWAREWTDLDELLQQLWCMELVHRELVATILEDLCEDIHNRDDPTVGLRMPELKRACRDIFIPLQLLRKRNALEEESPGFRHGPGDWLSRLSDFLDQALPNFVLENRQARSCTLRVYAVIRSVVTWAIESAISTTKCSERLAKGLTVPDHGIQLAAVESLYALLSRERYSTMVTSGIFSPIFEPESIAILRQLYEWTVFDPSQFQEDKYILAKKLSELISKLGIVINSAAYLQQNPESWQKYLSLLVLVIKSQSLTISCPALVSWTKLMRTMKLEVANYFPLFVGEIYEICSQRLIRYENLPEASNDPTLSFLDQDLDTVLERHTFIGNYRKYAKEAIEVIIIRSPVDCIISIYDEANRHIRMLSHNRPRFSTESYATNSINYLLVDAQLVVVETAAQAYHKWKESSKSYSEAHEQRQALIDDMLQAFCTQLFHIEFEDPLILKRIVVTAVHLATKLLIAKGDFYKSVLTYILSTQIRDDPEYPVYSEAVKDLYIVSAQQLQLLAVANPDFLASVYYDIELTIKEIVAQSNEWRRNLALQSVLFIINHRSATISEELRIQRLMPTVEAIKRSWEDPELKGHLESFRGFCKFLSVNEALKYLHRRGAFEMDDWSSYLLDEEGKAIRDKITERFTELPLKATKTYLAVTIDKLEAGSSSYEVAMRIWQGVPSTIMLPILKFLGYSQAYSATAAWTKSTKMEQIANRVLNDRFWQAGISTGTREDFYAKIASTKGTLEGFASSLRGVIRTVRETSYTILYCMSRLDKQFYMYDELPELLTKALCANADSLSAYQFTTLASTARLIILGCPEERRQAFLTPFLSELLGHIDFKVTSGWNAVMDRLAFQMENDDLSDEMRDESVLRQLTYLSVLMVSNFLDPNFEKADRAKGSVDHTVHPNDTPGGGDESKGGQGQRAPSKTMRAFVLSNATILGPLITFCAHVLGFPDTRSCSIILAPIKSMCQEFKHDRVLSHATREFISNVILRATITAFLDPHMVEIQHSLASLIAEIYQSFSPVTPTPRKVLMELPGVTLAKLEMVDSRLSIEHDERQSRSLMASLLDGLKGLNISQQGRIPGTTGIASGGGGGGNVDEFGFSRLGGRKKRIARGSGYGGGGAGAGEGSMATDGHGNFNHGEMFGRESPDLSGMADMFG